VCKHILNASPDRATKNYVIVRIKILAQRKWGIKKGVNEHPLKLVFGFKRNRF